MQPSKGPDMLAVEVTKPNEETMCQEGKHPLRVKQLIKLHFTPAAQDKDAPQSAGAGKYMCPVCRYVFAHAHSFDYVISR